MIGCTSHIFRAEPHRMNGQQLRRALECPVCFLLRRGPIYVCRRGHSVSRLYWIYTYIAYTYIAVCLDLYL